MRQSVYRRSVFWWVVCVVGVLVSSAAAQDAPHPQLLLRAALESPVAACSASGNRGGTPASGAELSSCADCESDADPGLSFAAALGRRPRDPLLGFSRQCCRSAPGDAFESRLGHPEARAPPRSS
jgi:hypothetical protein